MAIRPICLFRDPRLSIAASRVTAFDEALLALSHDLLETMRAAPGVGITAPHIGVSQRVVVLDRLTPDGVPHTYVNPAIVWASSEKSVHSEGSISMPGVVADVERHTRVRIAYQDLSGADQTDEASGLAAICLQHEIDQLDGLFWIHRLSRLKRDRTIARFDKLRRAGLQS